ncbi:MAG: hypothetical protein WBO12_06765, partial [Xanthobacteraceae bacterium]
MLRLKHDPEKWTAVFGKDHAQINKLKRNTESNQNHFALARRFLQLGGLVVIELFRPRISRP